MPKLSPKTRKNLPTLPDLFLVGGLCLVWYGLFLHEPWVAHAVTGGVMVCLAIASRFGGNSEASV